MAEPLLDRVVHEATRWCNKICRVHGAPGEFRDALWLTPRAVPRFYPNLITLRGEEAAGLQLRAIEQLDRSGLARGWGVKDSFACLELVDLGFELLFESTWIARPPEQDLLPDPEEGLDWTLVANGSELASWERAWSGNEANASNALQTEPRFFPANLLRDPELHFLAGRGRKRGWRDRPDPCILAVAIAMRGERSVYLSNVFAGPGATGPWWPGCVRLVRERFPDLPILGYERGDDLGAARAAGFETLHPLRVWTRST